MCSRRVVSILCARYCSLSLVVTKPPGLAVNKSSLDLTLLTKLDPRPTHGMEASAEQSRFGGGWPAQTGPERGQELRWMVHSYRAPLSLTCDIFLSAWYPTFSWSSTVFLCSLPTYVQLREWEIPAFPRNRRHIPINLVILFRTRQVIHPDLPIRCFRVPSTPNPTLGGPTNSVALSFQRPRFHP